MSDSRAKYEELIEKKGFKETTPHQKSLQLICEIVHAASRADLVEELVNKALEISKDGSMLTPATVFQIAADAVKVDELCNKIK
jgi:hypothetical protein